MQRAVEQVHDPFNGDEGVDTVRKLDFLFSKKV